MILSFVGLSLKNKLVSFFFNRLFEDYFLTMQLHDARAIHDSLCTGSESRASGETGDSASDDTPIVTVHIGAGDTGDNDGAASRSGSPKV